MAVRKAAVPGLSEEDIAALRLELSQNRRPTVWFTPAAVGITPGQSAKVFGIGDPVDGDFIQVRETGTTDTLPVGPAELTRVKPARVVKKPAPVPKPAPKPIVDEYVPYKPTPVKPTPVKSVAQPAVVQPVPVSKPVAKAITPRPNEVSVLLQTSGDGQWTVDVTIGRRKPIKNLTVPVSGVSAAAKALGGEVEESISQALELARQVQLDKVTRLKAELEAAQAALGELR